MKKITFFKIMLALLGLSYNANAQWTSVSITGSTKDVRCLASTGTNIFAGTYGDGMFLSTNNGNSWTAVNTGLSSGINTIAISGTNIFAGAADGYVYKSTNNGSSWTAGAYVGGGQIFTLLISGTNIFAGTNGGGVFLSTDNGSTWTATGNLPGNIVNELALSGTNIIAATCHGIWKSTNNGGTWIDISSPAISTLAGFTLTVNGSNIFAGMYAVGEYLSTDNGVTWAHAITGLTTTDVRRSTKNGNNIYAGTFGGGVFVTGNNGSSWADVSTGMTNTFVRSLAVIGTNLFAGTTSGGVFTRPLSQLIGVEELQVENTFSIAPNPFTSHTTIKSTNYQIQSIKVMDISGQSVYQSEIPNPKSEISLDMTGYSKGIYFLQVMDEKKNVVNKKIIIQ